MKNTITYDWINNKVDYSKEMEGNYFFHKVREFMIRCIAERDYVDFADERILARFYEDSKGPDQYYYTTREDAERIFKEYVRLILRKEKKEIKEEAMQLRKNSKSSIESIVNKKESER